MRGIPSLALATLFVAAESHEQLAARVNHSHQCARFSTEKSNCDGAEAALGAMNDCK